MNVDECKNWARQADKHASMLLRKSDRYKMLCASIGSVLQNFIIIDIVLIITDYAVGMTQTFNSPRYQGPLSTTTPSCPVTLLDNEFILNLSGDHVRFRRVCFSVGKQTLAESGVGRWSFELKRYLYHIVPRFEMLIGVIGPAFDPNNILPSIIAYDTEASSIIYGKKIIKTDVISLVGDHDIVVHANCATNEIAFTVNDDEWSECIHIPNLSSYMPFIGFRTTHINLNNHYLMFNF
jgi:hypothetical protein